MTPSRRGLLASLAAAPLAGKGHRMDEHAEAIREAVRLLQESAVQVTWYAEPCPRCKRDVLFEAKQTRNRCGWCKTTVERVA